MRVGYPPEYRRDRQTHPYEWIVLPTADNWQPTTAIITKKGRACATTFKFSIECSKVADYSTFTILKLRRPTGAFTENLSPTFLPYIAAPKGDSLLILFSELLASAELTKR